MYRKRKTLMKSLLSEKEKLEEKIHRLVREREDMGEKMSTLKTDELVDGLRHEMEELEERITRLQKEKEEILQHLEVEEIIGGLKCPKDFICYNTKYQKICNAGTVGGEKILCCLEEDPEGCVFSLLYKETYYCQCPLRNYIAEKMGR